MVITAPGVLPQLSELFGKLKKERIEIVVNTSVQREPVYKDFEQVSEEARQNHPEGIIGIGGGSVMDVAKLGAAQLNNH